MLIIIIINDNSNNINPIEAICGFGGAQKESVRQNKSSYWKVFLDMIWIPMFDLEHHYSVEYEYRIFCATPLDNFGCNYWRPIGFAGVSYLAETRFSRL